MSGLVAGLLALGLELGPGSPLAYRQLARPELLERLPLEAFLPLTGRLWWVFHHDPELPLAFYAPPAAMPADTPAEGSFERLLPGLAVPRFFLHVPTYREDGGLRPPETWAVDVADAYFRALLDAHLGLEPGPEVSRRRLEERAQRLMAELPEGERLAAYRSALAAFGAHALTVANEVERAWERQRAAGKDLCRLLEHPGTLFGLWRGIFGAAPYRGQVFRGAPPAEGVWVSTRAALEAEDKRWLVREVFGGRWTGDPAVDFARLCG